MMVAEHICNAYCRGDRHADICWSPPELARATEEEITRAFLGHFGLRLLAFEEAPEAQLTADDHTMPRYQMDDHSLYVVNDPIPTDYIAYLYIYEEATA